MVFCSDSQIMLIDFGEIFSRIGNYKKKLKKMSAIYFCARGNQVYFTPILCSFWFLWYDTLNYNLTDKTKLNDRFNLQLTIKDMFISKVWS